MKIAILGTTLHAGVMAALLSEYGNQVYWCHQNSYLNKNISGIEYQEEEVNRRLIKQRDLGSLIEKSLVDIPVDMEVYFSALIQLSMTLHSIH